MKEPYSNALPVKVRGRNNRMRFSCLDTYAMAYAIDLDRFGFYHKPSEELFVKRIQKALEVDMISNHVDQTEFLAATTIMNELRKHGHLFGAKGAMEPEVGQIESAHVRSRIFQTADYPVDAAPTIRMQDEHREQLKSFVLTNARDAMLTRSELVRSGQKRKLVADHNPHAFFVKYGVGTMEEAVVFMQRAGMEQTYDYKWMQESLGRARRAAEAAATYMNEVREVAREVDREQGKTLPPFDAPDYSRPAKLPRVVQKKVDGATMQRVQAQDIAEAVVEAIMAGRAGE